MPYFIDPQVSEKLTIRNCDCVIVCDGHRFRAHRSVIEKHSPILAAAFNGSFKESHTMTYDATAFETDTIANIILWAYGHGDAVDGLCAGTECRPERLEETLVSLVRLNAAADYFGIEQLAMETAKSIEAILAGDWQTKAFVKAAKVVADECGDAKVHRAFTAAAAKHIEDLASTTMDITDLAALDGFAPVMVKAAAMNMAKLRSEMEGIKGHVKWMKSEMETHKKATEKAMKELSDTDVCCRCDSEFAGYVQTYDGYIFTVRCKNCFAGRL